ncbi:hypothetical protein [Carnobacterium maltaromaticum]|uniref:hypothetical protein n=1 Tax=Carnobacterium maltaromaticum TaxID=2751 RepID=UPI001D618575|nr:hypothetical protein [Carnobacterium maltaromaticum]MCC4310701.1 hypothetical protein [Carnobacterium maltaromaticum]
MNRVFISGEIHGEIETLHSNKGKVAKFTIQSHQQQFTVLFYRKQIVVTREGMESATGQKKASQTD